MIKWFDIKEKEKNLISTICDTNITLNKHCCIYLETAYTVMLGINYDKRLIYIKPLTKDIATRGDIPSTSQYNLSLRSTYARVSNVEFIKEIKGLLNLESFKGQPRKYNVSYSEKERCLIIDLKEEV